MSSANTRVLKNTTALLVSQLLTWVLTLLLTLVMPRYLGPEGNGLLVLSGSIWAIIMVMIAFGMDTYIVKLVARTPEQRYSALGTSLALRTMFFLTSLVPVAIVITQLELSPEAIAVLLLLGLSAFFYNIAGGVQAVLQGLEIMEYISISMVLSRALNSLLGIAVLVSGFGIVELAVVMMSSGFVFCAAQLFFLHRHTPLRLRFDRALALPILKQSLPYVATALVMVGYAQINVLVLGMTMSPVEVGWYGAASQLFGTLLFLPVVFATALLPQMARSFADNQGNAPERMLRKSVELVLMIGVPIGCGLVVIAEPLVALIYGAEFAPTAPVLKAMGVTLIFMYLNILVGQYFTSVDRQNTWTATICGSIVLMGAMTVVLVPRAQAWFGNGALGGAISLLLAEMVMVLIGVALLRGRLVTLSSLWVISRILIAAGVMTAGVWWLGSAPLFVLIAAGVVIYGGMIALLRVVPREDLAVLTAFVSSLIRRLRPQGRAVKAGN